MQNGSDFFLWVEGKFKNQNENGRDRSYTGTNSYGSYCGWNTYDRLVQSEDGATGKNRPKSLLGMIIGDGTEKSKEIQTFDSGEDFDREWARLTGKEG